MPPVTHNMILGMGAYMCTIVWAPFVRTPTKAFVKISTFNIVYYCMKMNGSFYQDRFGTNIRRESSSKREYTYFVWAGQRLVRLHRRREALRRQGKTTPFVRHFTGLLKIIILPRQARDKH
jgi:hypothetical protein